MILREWNDLPKYMRNKDVKVYYDILKSRHTSLLLKRIFDFTAAFLMIIMLLPVFFIIGVAIKIDSKGPIMFRQVRVTQYGRKFNIFKFRTMVPGTGSCSAGAWVDKCSRTC